MIMVEICNGSNELFDYGYNYLLVTCVVIFKLLNFWHIHTNKKVKPVVLYKYNKQRG